jgi:mono/diheme cytochrome c family protein
MRRFVYLALIATIHLAGCGPENPRAARISAIEGSAIRGQELFAAHCVSCHKRGGLMRTVAWYPKGAFLTVVLDGVAETEMPGYASLSDQEIADIYAYIEDAGKR